MRMELGSVAPRGAMAALLLAFPVVLAGLASAQIQAPRYQSPIAAPKPQPQFTMPPAPSIRTK